MEISLTIRHALEELFSKEPLDDCFVVDIVPSGRRGITVYIDSDSGVTLDKCTRVSRYLEELLDAQNFQGGEYVLDVSSPGVDRPLILWRQYPRQKGRDLLVTLADGQQVEGKLVEVTMDHITLTTAGEKSVDIPFEEISESIVQISF